MKRFSSNITDEELYRVFRNAARHYDPKLNDSERKGVWESIANSLLSDTAGDTSTTNKWKRRCIALLLLWLLTGGLSIFRIIQLQEASGHRETDTTTNEMALKKKDSHHIQRGPVLTSKQKKTTAIKPVPGYEDIRKNITPCLRHWEISGLGNFEIAIPQFPDSTVLKPDSPLAKKRQRPKQGWSIGLATGTEWSKVPGNPMGGAGIQYGFTIQYRFAPRWSVETALMVTPKLYSTQVHASYSSRGTFLDEPNTIDVNCRIIDIQMNIRFDVMHKREGRLFTGAGLSSFRIQKEDYTFHFELGGTRYQSNVRQFNQNNHLFAAANVMAGYEYIQKRFSLQAAPYIKIPLKHIGMGQVDLFSTGLQLSVKYNSR